MVSEVSVHDSMTLWLLGPWWSSILWQGWGEIRWSKAAHLWRPGSWRRGGLRTVHSSHSDLPLGSALAGQVVKWDFTLPGRVLRRSCWWLVEGCSYFISYLYVVRGEARIDRLPTWHRSRYTERHVYLPTYLSSFFLPFFLPICIFLCMYLPIIYPSIHPSIISLYIYLFIYLPIIYLSLSFYPSAYYLFIDLSVIYLSIYEAGALRHFLS
jgi:hypothetical protein